MNRLNILTCICIVAAALCSCSSRRSPEEKKTKITGLSPVTKNPSVGVVNASGDALTPGIHSTNNNSAGSQEKAAQIANNAIMKASSSVRDQLGLYALTGQDFISRATSSGDWEIEAGKLALEKSASAKIREYATMVLKDHREIREAFAKLASGGAKLSDTLITSLQASSRNIRQTAMPPAGSAAFDASYITMTIQDHRELIRLFEAAGRAKDETISAFAKKYLPVLRQHLAAAQELTKVSSGKP